MKISKGEMNGKRIWYSGNNERAEDKRRIGSKPAQWLLIQKKVHVSLAMTDPVITKEECENVLE